MKSIIRSIDNHGLHYDCLMFVCPGCVSGGPEGYSGLHMLPVNTDVITPAWTWDWNLEKPTLTPSILTYESGSHPRCHSFLTQGVFKFLEDSTHPLKGQTVEIPELPDWVQEFIS